MHGTPDAQNQGKKRTPSVTDSFNRQIQEDEQRMARERVPRQESTSGRTGSSPRIAVIGTGASGLACAISCARAGASVTAFEKEPRAGKPILASGNGRCNFTNAHLAPSAYNDPAFVGQVLGTDPLADVLGFFDSLGLWYFADDHGRYFPASRAAASVLNVMLDACDELGIRNACDCRVQALQPPLPQSGATGWLVRYQEKPRDACRDERRDARRGAKRNARKVGMAAVEKSEPFDAVVWAAGGGSARDSLGKLGVVVTDERPVLCPLATDTSMTSGLDGVRAACRARLFPAGAAGSTAGPLFDDRGEVLFRPYGISGIVTFDMSRFAHPGDIAELDLLPGFSEERLEDALADRLRAHPSRYATPDGILSLLEGIAHPALGAKIVRLTRDKAGKGTADATAENRAFGPAFARQCARLLKHYRMSVLGVADESHAQVTRGGVATGQVDPATLAVLDPGLRGLFVCGEALDVDGACGGFNLSWAWLSGMVAGRSSADYAFANGAGTLSAQARML